MEISHTGRSRTNPNVGANARAAAASSGLGNAANLRANQPTGPARERMTVIAARVAAPSVGE